MIKEEDFKKLKQNDRIEFLLRLNHIHNKHNDPIPFWIWIFIIGFLLLDIGYYLICEDFIILNNPTSISICIFFAILGISILLYDSVAKGIKQTRLKEEFFTFETKPKKK